MLHDLSLLSTMTLRQQCGGSQKPANFRHPLPAKVRKPALEHSEADSTSTAALHGSELLLDSESWPLHSARVIPEVSSTPCLSVYTAQSGSLTAAVRKSHTVSLCMITFSVPSTDARA